MNTTSTVVRKSWPEVFSDPANYSTRDAPFASPLRGLIDRVLVLVGCATFTVVAIFSGLDRVAAGNPSLAHYVPRGFAAQSLLAQGRELLDAQQFTVADAVAREAINAAPIEPESTALLGASRLGLADEPGAEKAFRVAGQFGWRTPITQYYWMQKALIAGDYRVAALRLDALLRQNLNLAGKADLLHSLESAEPGRAALADRLSEGPGWLPNYIGTAFDLSLEDAAYRADVLNRLARRGKPVGCVAISTLIRRLVSLDDLVLAHAVWRAHCPVRSTGLIADTAFESLQMHQANSPFEWLVLGDSDISLSLELTSGGADRRLLLASSSPFPRKVLTQLVVVPPGTYRLSWRALTSNDKPSNRISATLSCAPDSHDWLPASQDTQSRRWYSTVRIDGSCQAVWVGFTVQPGQESVALDGISLVPLP